MVEQTTTHVIFALLIFLLCYLAAVFHEGSHWVMARIWSADLGVVPKFWIFSGAINIRSPYEIPPHGIRLAGMVPLLFCLPLPHLVLHPRCALPGTAINHVPSMGGCVDDQPF